jgi:cytochrome c oxidase cbb3-type subunit 4
MDVNDIRALVTLFSFSFFSGLMAWTYWPARRDSYDSAAQLPFAGEMNDAHPNDAHRGARDE